MRRVFAVGAAILALAGCASSADSADEETTVSRVIDGDTIETSNGERVRLVQIDAPELQDGECYAVESTGALDELIPAGPEIRLEADPRLDDVAASVWFFEGDRGRYADELLDAASAAEDADNGLWGACPAAGLDPEQGVDTG